MKSNLISNMEGRFLLFVFAPCATVWVPRYTHKVRSLQVLRRLRCSLFWHVAATFLSLPLKSAHFSSTSSLLFSQRAAAFRLSNIFIDPPACLMTFHIIFSHALSSKSCPHILPRFSFLKQVIWHRGVDRRWLHKCEILRFCKLTSSNFVWHCCALVLWRYALLMFLNHPPYIPPAFWRLLLSPRIALLLQTPCQVIFYYHFSEPIFNLVIFLYLSSWSTDSFTITCLNPLPYIPPTFPNNSSHSS